MHEDSGIQSFQDLKDITLAISRSAAFADYLRRKVPLTGVKIVPYSGNVWRFCSTKITSKQGYVFSEPLIVRRRGGDARVLMLSDLDFNPYTSVLFTSEAVLREQPDVARRMVAASARGWAKYLASPIATNQKIREADREIDLDILTAGGESIRPMVFGDVAQKEYIGAMSLARWQLLRTNCTNRASSSRRSRMCKRPSRQSFSRLNHARRRGEISEVSLATRHREKC